MSTNVIQFTRRSMARTVYSVDNSIHHTSYLTRSLTLALGYIARVLKKPTAEITTLEAVEAGFTIRRL